MASNAAAFRKLAEFTRRVETLPKIREEASKRMANETLRFIKQQIARGEDPYGGKLAPKKKPDGRKVLHGKTGKLRRFRVEAYGPNGFRVGTNANYFKYHQRGTRHMVRRQMTVGKGEPLPKKWLAAYRTISLNLFRKHFGGR